MYTLTEGALDKIMNGVDVDKPVLQILGHKRLASSSSGERYRLLVSDGKRINSFTMLATQLNSMITDKQLTEFTICQITKYAISMVNNTGKQKRVMVILNVDVKVPGVDVGHKIGNPMNTAADSDAKPTNSRQTTQSLPPPQRSGNMQQHNNSSMSSTDDISTTPIAALSPYHNRWVVKVRLVNKSDIRTWSNSRGEGKLFSMDLVDESGEIRCTAFKDQCDKFYDMLEVGKVYYISRATLKTANKQFNHLKNDYEMTLGGETEIIPCHDAVSDLPTLQFDFVQISDVEKREKNDMMDILGVVKSVGDLQMLTSRTTGRDMRKKDVTLVDESNTMVTLTLWGTQAETFDGSGNPVLAIKGARVGEFNGGKNLSTLSSSILQVDPDIPAAHRLRGWFNTIGRDGEAKSISKGLGGSGGGNGPLITFVDAKNMGYGLKSTDVFMIKATVNMIRIENALYKSCPFESCKKKVIDQANDMYRCEKCDKEYPNFRYRLLASLSLSDCTGHHWATAFSEEAEKILGIMVQELGELQENDNEAYLEKFGEATFKSFMFKIRVKTETYSDTDRLRAVCVSVSPVDYTMHNEHLITQIKELAGIGKA